MENKIRNNREFFGKELPEGHQARFAAKLQSHMIRKRRMRQLVFNLLSATAAVGLIILFLNNSNMIQSIIYQEDRNITKLRTEYERQVNEAISMLENVLMEVSDSTKHEINMVIENLNNASEAFKEIESLPEEKQIAIITNVYEKKLGTIDLLRDKINKK